MGINWKKVGQFVVDAGLDSLESAGKRQERIIKNNLKKKNLTEEQREVLEEKLEHAQNFNENTQYIKENYHS